MKVSLEKEGNNVVHLGVELEPDKALIAYERACRNLSQKINIPGFRKGKAPRNIIEKTVGVDYIKREALEHLVPELLGRAIVDENLDVITEPEIDSCDFELGSPLKLSAKFEIRPEVKLGDYIGVKVNVPEAAMPGDAVQRALNNIAESKASLQAVDKRPVKMGDTVVMDFECFVDDKLVEGGKAEGLILEMKEGNFLEGFCEQVIGKEPETSTEVNVRFPDEYRNKELAGKDAHFKVDIKGIRERVIPDINDELAQSLGQESMERLTELVEQRLGEEVQQENGSRVQRAVVDAVINNAEVEIPETMVEREFTLLLDQFRQIVEQNGQTWDAFQEAPEFENIRGVKREEARQRVLTSLVLGAIVRAEKMAVTEEEMAPYLAELAGRYNVPIERVARNEEARRQVMEEILTQKVVEYLVTHAEVNFIPDEQPNAEDSAEETAKPAKAEAKASKEKGEGKTEAKAEAKSGAKSKSKKPAAE
jgi:trigger factor